MKAKIILERCYKDIICIAVMLIAVLTIIYSLYDLQNMEWNIPLAYSGGDDMSYLVDARMLSESPWMMESDRLAAPFGSNDNDFFASNLHRIDMLMLKGIVRVVQDPAIAVNILFLSTFPIIAIMAYFAIRCLKMKPWIAAVGGILYSFTPYIFMRGLGHLVLSSYYFIPLSILLCVWIFEDDNFFKLNKSFFKYWKNWVAIIGAVLIANNGIAYYPFFTCFFLIVTGLSKVIKTRKWNSFGKASAIIGMICTWVLVSLIPSFIHISQSGANKEAIFRTVGATENYGLKIAQLIMPVNGHGIPYLEDLIDTYNESMPLINENTTAYLGIIGIVGFLGLLAFLFVKNISKDKAYQNRLVLLSELNIGAVLLGTIGGFSSLIGVAITSMIRCYNRISIFILFFCILAVCIILNEVAIKICEKRYIYIAFIASVCIFSLFNIYDSYPDHSFNYAGNKVSYLSDKNLVEKIESSVPENSMIFQLPYHMYPEGGVVNSMQDYDLFRGFIHSKTLKWSFGGTKGRESDMYNRNLSQMPVEEMFFALKEAGFAGVYIDANAYKIEEFEVLEIDMAKSTGNEPLISDDGLRYFYSFN